MYVLAVLVYVYIVVNVAKSIRVYWMQVYVLELYIKLYLIIVFL